MLVQIVGLSVVLVATLIILFVCISGNINLKMEVDKLKRQNDSLQITLKRNASSATAERLFHF